jgi:acyl-coenzyme A synthetase/AMP-(fatty) acid ligase
MALQGRVTGVINVAGQKISPEPIEDALRAALGVTGACLVSAQDAAGEEALHLVLETSAPLDPAALTDVLQRELRGFPGVHVHYVPALPRNPMGKMLRQAVTALAVGAG